MDRDDKGVSFSRICAAAAAARPIKEDIDVVEANRQERMFLNSVYRFKIRGVDRFRRVLTHRLKIQKMAEFKSGENGGGTEFETQYKLIPRVTISDNTSEVFCVRFSPDGKFLAVKILFYCFEIISS